MSVLITTVDHTIKLEMDRKVRVDIKNDKVSRP